MTTRTLPDLIARAGLERIDVYVSDTEGHDWTILRQLDIARFRPRLIVVELHTHPSDERRAARDFLEGFGYATRQEGADLIATRAA